MYADPNDGPPAMTRAESDALADRLIARLASTPDVVDVPCLNAACPDPGPHAHLIDSRDDLDAARWTGYTPTDPAERCTPTGRAGRDGRRYLSCGHRENPARICSEHGQAVR